MREIFEETGLRVKKPILKGIITFPEFTPNHDWYTYVFKVTEFEGELIDCDEGTLEWVPVIRILSRPTWEEIIPLYRNFKKIKPFSRLNFLTRRDASGEPC